MIAPVPLIVIEGSARAAARAVARLREAGWDVQPGWRSVAAGPSGSGRGSRRVCEGEVRDATDAAAALLAALDGAGLVVRATADRELIHRLVDDLRRLGSVDHRVGDTVAPPPLPTDAIELLRLLAAGKSLGEAAATLGLARRTADRRLGAARRSLGVERTTQAIAQARRLGWLGD